MALTRPFIVVPHDLIEAIRAFPVTREVEHCGSRFSTSPFEIYARCPRCGAQIKLRSFSGVGEIEDVFDAVFEWMTHPEAQALVAQRQQVITDDSED